MDIRGDIYDMHEYNSFNTTISTVYQEVKMPGSVFQFSAVSPPSDLGYAKYARYKKNQKYRKNKLRWKPKTPLKTGITKPDDSNQTPTVDTPIIRQWESLSINDSSETRADNSNIASTSVSDSNRDDIQGTSTYCNSSQRNVCCQSEIRKWLHSNTGNLLLRQPLETDQGLALVRELLDTTIGRALMKERIDADRPTYIENIEMLIVQSLPWSIEYKPGNTNLSIVFRLAMPETDHYLNWVLVNFSLTLENNKNDEESIRLENIIYKFKPGSTYVWSDVIPLTVLDNPQNGYLNESGENTVTVQIDRLSYDTNRSY